MPTALIGTIIALTMGAMFYKHRDTFHPALLLGPMLGFHYVYSPLRLMSTDGFSGFLWESHVERAQWIHLTGVLAMCAGLVVGSWRNTRPTRETQSFGSNIDRATVVRGSIVLGVLGIAGFVYGIINVGGFSQAYGRAYGGGGSDSGWVREIVLLCLPAIFLLSIRPLGRRLSMRVLLLVPVFAGPFLIHGLLGARRGPTFMGLVGPGMVFYMARNRRPSLPVLLSAGAVLGIFMLALVSNRGSFYWGGSLDFTEAPSAYLQPGAGNDFIYGAGLVIVVDETEDFSWGTTYLTTLFVRPIPRQIWPTKYEDAAKFFNRPSLNDNLGVDVTSFRDVLGWTAAFGAAPGIVGDMWREFCWGMVVVLFGLGWFYSYAWRRAIEDRGAWVPIYCFLASLSLYMVMQTLEAMLFRFLFGVAPMLFILRRARRAAGRASIDIEPNHPPLAEEVAR